MSSFSHNFPLISVILSTYNSATTLPDAINSILAQSYRNIELILIDDGSTDDTLNIINHYLALDHRIVSISHPNQGLTKSLNAGLRLASGTLIARQDSDDVSHKDRLMLQSYQLFNSNLDLVASLDPLYHSSSPILRFCLCVVPPSVLLYFFNPFVHGSYLFKRQIRKLRVFYDQRIQFAQDYELLTRLLMQGARVKLTHDKIYFRSLSDTSLSSLYHSKQKQSFLMARSTFRAFLAKRLYSLFGIHRLARNFPITKRQRIPDFPPEASAQDVSLMSEILFPDDPQNRLSLLSINRLWAALSSVQYIVDHQLAGDIVECGVWRGGCSIAMALKLSYLSSTKKIYMYDTFEGMTSPTDFDVHRNSLQPALIKYNDSVRSTHCDWCYASLSDVTYSLEKYDLLSSVRLIKGDVLETLSLSSNLPASISLLRLDTDWYESTKYELEVLYPLVTHGGIVLIDDYGHWDGARRAVDEFLTSLPPSKRPILWITDRSGRAFIKP